MFEWFVWSWRSELQQFGRCFQQHGQRQRFEQQFWGWRFVRVCRSVALFAMANQWPGQQWHAYVHRFEQLRNSKQQTQRNGDVARIGLGLLQVQCRTDFRSWLCAACLPRNGNGSRITRICARATSASRRNFDRTGLFESRHDGSFGELRRIH